MLSIRSSAAPLPSPQLPLLPVGRNWRAVTLRVAALFACTLLSGCALFRVHNPEHEVPTGGVVSTAPGQDERAIAAESALASATQAWRDGDALGAMSIANGALRQGVPAEYEPKLRAIRSKAREALVTQKITRISILPDRDAVADGTDVRGIVRVRNVSSAPLSIPATADDSSTSQVVLHVVRDDFDLYGSKRSTEFNVRVPLENDLDIGPGGTADVRISIPAVHTRLSHTGFAVLRIGGHLRPVLIRVGATEFFDALDLDEAFVRVFMDGYEQLAEDPFGSLEKAVARRSPPHILTAAELLAPDERARAATLLLDAADADPDLAFVCRATAARLNALLVDARR
jgi:hypothetical protein